uniref:CCHC-type domain-containing protein n=1 Tax=Crocodylus porosus TaxID=8502 RepID=A0A7M4EMU8_CROPO
MASAPGSWCRSPVCWSRSQLPVSCSQCGCSWAGATLCPPPPAAHRQAFRARKAGEKKSPRALWQCLADLLNKWPRPELLSREQVCDQILEQFINDLKEDTQRWVKCHCPTSSREALQLAEQFDTAQGGWRQGRNLKGAEAPGNRNTDLKMGHKKTPLNLACFTCRQKGHIARHCPRGSRFSLVNEPGLSDGRQGQGLPREVESMDCGVGSQGQVLVQPLPQVQAIHSCCSCWYYKELTVMCLI